MQLLREKQLLAVIAYKYLGCYPAAYDSLRKKNRLKKLEITFNI